MWLISWFFPNLQMFIGPLPYDRHMRDTKTDKTGPDLPEILKSDPDISACSNPSHGSGTWLYMRQRHQGSKMWLPQSKASSEPVSYHSSSMLFLIIFFLLEYVTLKKRIPRWRQWAIWMGKAIVPEALIEISHLLRWPFTLSTCAKDFSIYIFTLQVHRVLCNDAGSTYSCKISFY